MPYAIEKVKGGYRVRNTETNEIHAKRTTMDKAKAQVRLLNMVEHGVKLSKEYIK